MIFGPTLRQIKALPRLAPPGGGDESGDRRQEGNRRRRHGRQLTGFCTGGAELRRIRGIAPDDVLFLPPRVGDKEEMTADSSELVADVWSNWLLHLRHGGDPDYDRMIRARVERYVERVLDGARLGAGMTFADIGTGEGVLGFRAIERVGPSLRVLFVDVSAPMLRHAEQLATERGVREQCSFLECGADQLSRIDTGSVDALATRAALAYVADKLAAFREFRRALKPGGRISLAEPILRDEALAVSALRQIVAATSAERRDPALPLVHRWKAAQFPDTPEKIQASPITNYSERDLVAFCRAAGFVDIHLELHIDVLPIVQTSWETFLRAAPHPWAPPLKDILAAQFTAEERAILEADIRRALATPRPVGVERMAYLTATAPAG
jgi:arsenite methyltransferase